MEYPLSFYQIRNLFSSNSTFPEKAKSPAYFYLQTHMLSQQLCLLTISLFQTHWLVLSNVIIVAYLLKQIQHIIQVDFFPNMQLVPGLYHIIEQKLQNQCTAKTPPFDLKIRKAHWQIYILDCINTNKSRILHCL